MNHSEIRTYIERQLVKLGWIVKIDKAGYKKIHDFTGGNEERLGQLYYKLVGMGSQQPNREVTDATVSAAIADLKRMEQIVDKAKAEGRSGPKTRAELDRISIEQLAKELETEVALEAKEARLAAEKFPTVEPAQAASAQASGTPAAPSSLPRILVVDDSPTIRVAVTKALKNDFSFVQAADGEEAWKLLKSDDSIQLVVTDLIMPKLDGYELIKRIRSDRTSSRIAEMPVIVVTTLEDTNAKLRALVAGANDFVSKSTDAVELKMRVMARFQVARSGRATGQEQGGNRRIDATAAREARVAMPATPGGNGAAPRTAPATQVAASSHARTVVTPANAAPQRAPQAPTPTMGRNAAGANAARPNGGSPGAAVRAMDAGRTAPGMRTPISPAAIPTTTSSVREALAERGMSPFVNIIDGWNRLRERLAKTNPLTATTIGATALIILIVGVIFFINRQHRVVPPPTASIPEAETLATSQGNSSASSALAPVAVEPAKPPVRRDPATGTDEQPVRKVDKRPAEAVASVASSGRIPGENEASKTPIGKQDAATRTSTAPGHAKKPETKPKTISGDAAISTPEEEAPASSAAPTETAAVAPAVSTVAARDPASAATAAAAPAPAAPPSNAITPADLTKLVKKFEFVYEAGDIEQFLSLFGDQVETNDTFTKADLRRDYEDLFKTTEWRVMALPNVNWDIHDNKADGWGNFEVKVRKVGAKDVNDYKGSLTFHVEKIGGRLYIKRLYHGQWRAAG